MCVSAPVSFAVGGALAVVGAATIRKALLYDRRMLAFALFPAIFSFHQLTEGLVWLSIDAGGDGKPYSYVYIFIAVLLWPFLTPLASALAEPDAARRRLRYLFFAAALILAGYLVFKLATASGLDVKVVDHSLSYVIGYRTRPPAYADYAYAAVTLIPVLTLRNPALNLIGVLVGASFLYTILEMKEVWFSTWCLSAAICSGLLFFAVGGRKEAG
jgi:hypothetical protein